MTLDTHGHLFESRLGEVADAMDLARTNDRRAAAAAGSALPAVAPVLPEHDWHRNEKDLLASITAGQDVFLSCTPNGIRAGDIAVCRVRRFSWWYPQRDSNPCYRRERAAS